MLRTVIIDDEAKARETVRAALEMYCENVELIGEADSVKSGFELINNSRNHFPVDFREVVEPAIININSAQASLERYLPAAILDDCPPHLETAAHGKCLHPIGRGLFGGQEFLVRFTQLVDVNDQQAFVLALEHDRCIVTGNQVCFHLEVSGRIGPLPHLGTQLTATKKTQQNVLYYVNQ